MVNYHLSTVRENRQRPYMVQRSEWQPLKKIEPEDDTTPGRQKSSMFPRRMVILWPTNPHLFTTVLPKLESN